MNLLTTRAPSLPLATPLYSPPYVDQLNNVLRLYFNTIDSTFGALLTGNAGGKFLKFPYGAFFDTTTHTAASTAATYPITFNSTDFSNGVSLAAAPNNSRIVVAQSGIYNVQFSAQLANASNDGQDIEIWFRKNGTDIADSNTRFGLPPRKSTGAPSHDACGLNFFVSLDAQDYVELAWHTTSLDATIPFYTAPTSPTRPAIPSVILTVSFVSGI